MPDGVIPSKMVHNPYPVTYSILEGNEGGYKWRGSELVIVIAAVIPYAIQFL